MRQSCAELVSIRENDIGDGEEQPSQHVFVVDLTSRTPPYDRRLCEALQEEGAQVDLWAAGNAHAELLDDLAVPLRRGWTDLATRIPRMEWTGPLIKVLKAVEYLVNLVALLVAAEKEQPDLLHFQWLPLLDTVSVEIAFVRFFQSRGFKVVYTAHDVVPLDEREAPQSYERLYNAADAVICHTQQAKSRLVKEFHVEKEAVRIIPHGPLMDRDAFPPYRQARKHLEWCTEWPVALLFGVLRPYKGVEFLLRAWARVQEHVPQARLVVAGYAGPSYAKHLRGLRQDLEIGNAVEFRFRFLPEDELHALIAAADVLVYPYRNITQSGALFAGMNAGKAIVATCVGGLAEVLRDDQTGRFVEYGAYDHMAEQLSDLLQNPNARARLGHAAQVEMDDSYSWQHIAEKTVRYYAEVQNK